MGPLTISLVPTRTVLVMAHAVISYKQKVGHVPCVRTSQQL